MLQALIWVILFLSSVQKQSFNFGKAIFTQIYNKFVDDEKPQAQKDCWNINWKNHFSLFVAHFSLFVTPWYLKIFKTILYCLGQILLQKSVWNLFVIPLMGFQVTQWRKCAHWENHCKSSSDWPVWYFRVNPSLRNKYILGI